MLTSLLLLLALTPISQELSAVHYTGIRGTASVQVGGRRGVAHELDDQGHLGSR